MEVCRMHHAGRATSRGEGHSPTRWFWIWEHHARNTEGLQTENSKKMISNVSNNEAAVSACPRGYLQRVLFQPEKTGSR